MTFDSMCRRPNSGQDGSRSSPGAASGAAENGDSVAEEGNGADGTAAEAEAGAVMAVVIEIAGEAGGIAIGTATEGAGDASRSSDSFRE